jgi:hypothetical protein
MPNFEDCIFFETQTHIDVRIGLYAFRMSVCLSICLSQYTYVLFARIFVLFFSPTYASEYTFYEDVFAAVCGNIII